ncbi:MAG: hypothetical protein F4Z01_08215 [Gammaproteobacteria bacterium]|nr:hypothetical protein [Gammaproteobacteria bacterium]MYF37164.1 hypothetical protein [Gammaproteobacteria bacterium]
MTNSFVVHPAVGFILCLLKAIVVCGVVFLIAWLVLPFFSTLLFQDQVLANISHATHQAINEAYQEIFVRNDLPMTKYGAVSILAGFYLRKHFWFIFVSVLLGVSVALWRFNKGWTNFRECTA